jgi:hypothetical protein
VTAVTDAPPALPRIATPQPQPQPQPRPQPQPGPRATPPPIPRAPTQDEFTVAVPSLDTYAGDGTTRVVDASLSSPRSQRPILIAGLAVLVIATLAAIVIGSGILSGSRTDLDPTTARAVALDASSMLVVTPVSDAGAPSSDTRDPSPDAGAPSADATPDAGDPSADAAPDAGALTVPPPATATLEILARPDGARVAVDGARPRASPVVLRDLPPGKVAIVVTKDKYATATRTVELAAGEHRTLEIVLEKKSGGSAGARVGYLTARTQPYSVVFLGSRKLGETPFAGVELPVGRHVLTFKNPGKRPVTRTVTVKPGETIKLNFAL